MPEIASSGRVGADLATRTMGSMGGTFVALTVLLSIIGAVNGCVLAAARIPFAQARDGLFFARFGDVHPRFQTPGSAIVWGGVWTAILVLTGSYETLYSYSIVAAWIFYTMTVAAVFVLRIHEHGDQRAAFERIGSLQFLKARRKLWCEFHAISG